MKNTLNLAGILMDKIRELLNKQITSQELIEEDINKINVKLDDLNNSLISHVDARECIQKAKQMTQESLQGRLSKIVTDALQLVMFDMDLGFSVEFMVRRNSTECDMWITEGGEKYHPLDSCGFGAADVASFALRIGMWSLNKSEPFMVFDEPFRNLGSIHMPNAAMLMATLSEEMGIQMMVTTHEEDLKATAGRAYRVVKTGKVSKVILEKTPLSNNSEL